MPENEENRGDAPSQQPVNDPSAEADHIVSPKTLLTIYLCAAIGGTIAALADLVQKEQASAVLKITTISARHLNLALQPLYVFLLVVILGVLLCFVFQPRNRKAGFAVGAGVIASIMTVTPYQPLQTGQPSDTRDETFLMPGKQSIQLATSDFGSLELAAARTDVVVVPVRNDLAVAVEVMVSYYDRNSKRAYQQVQSIATGVVREFTFSATAQEGRVDGEFFLELAGERSSYLTASGNAPYRSPDLPLTRALPSFATTEVDTAALNAYLQAAGPSPRPATDDEVRDIYNKSTGIFKQLQQQLLTPRKW
ncbi:MAG: hypothetical protein Tsb0019_00170 [Roseibium sp.]